MTQVGRRARRSTDRHRTTARTLAVLGGLLIISAVVAQSASAVIVRLPSGEAKSYQPLRTAPKPFDAFFQNLDYNGGPVMASNANYTFYWRPAGAPAYPSDYQAGIDQYLTDLAHDSGGVQNVDSVATQYNDAAGHFADYSSTFAGRLDDSNPYPGSGCHGATVCLTDAQIQAELSSYITAHKLPRDRGHEYFLLLPPGVETCFNASGSEGCSAGSSVNPQYCAYHGNSLLGGSEFIYSNDGYVTGNSGCDDGNHPNGKTSDGALQGGFSHEHVESITDPEPNNAWTDFGGFQAGEIGDKCGGDYGTPLGTAANGASYNQVINGHRYWHQTEWSNQGDGCLQRLSFAGVRPAATFTAAAAGGLDIAFDATASTAPGGVSQYNWQFNDGPDATQTVVETDTPTVTHTFPAAGAYTVALTVFAADGTSIGTARSTSVGASDELPTAAYTPSTFTPIQGQIVSFAGSGSSDPDGAIVSYRWVWGDGTPDSAGPTPTHVFATAGVRSVGLYVTDADGGTAAVGHGITVGDEPPGAAYTPSTYSPAQGQTVAFDGRGSSDPDGTVVSYRWVWGDGTPDGSGPTATHAFTTIGVRSVALYVTDSDGRTAAVGHGITVSDELPAASYTPSTYAPGQGQTVSFNGSASADPDGSIVSYRWVWGDGTPDGSGARPTHVFTTQGVRSVGLYVTDSDGRTAAVGHGITVGDDLPAAAYTASTFKPAVGQTVSFDGLASSDPDGTIVTYRWVWGDGTADGSGPTPTHVFTPPGTFSVGLYVTDSDGRTAAVGHGVTVGGGTG
jgi:PKD repeat protein